MTEKFNIAFEVFRSRKDWKRHQFRDELIQVTGCTISEANGMWNRCQLYTAIDRAGSFADVKGILLDAAKRGKL